MHHVTKRRPLALTHWGIGLALFFGIGLHAPAARGQQPATGPTAQKLEKPPTAQTHPNNPELWDVDQMMEEAVLQISRRYNLNPAQENYTRLLLRERTLTFLEKYEGEVRELLKESIDLRRNVKTPTAEGYMRWATRAMPIYEAAKKAILDGNREWGEILDAEQRKTHEMDLNLMRTNFEQVTKLISEWGVGRTPAGLAAGATPAGPQPGAVAGQEALVSRAQPAVERRNVEDNWSAYVNLFIVTYQLDEKQSNAAREGILKEANSDASKYRQRYKDRFAELDAGSDMKASDRFRKRSELERPLRDIFVSMHKRLNSLPDSKQRAGADVARVRQLEAMYKILTSESPVEPPPAAQPQVVAPKQEPKKAADPDALRRAKEAAQAKKAAQEAPKAAEQEKATLPPNPPAQPKQPDGGRQQATEAQPKPPDEEKKSDEAEQKSDETQKKSDEEEKPDNSDSKDD